jgi:transposase
VILLHLDMRKSFDAMAAIITTQFKKNIFEGHLFVFSNRQGSRIKLFYWDRNGYCFWYKRLEKGVFRLPKVLGELFTLSAGELSLLLEGIELTHPQRLRAC